MQSFGVTMEKSMGKQIEITDLTIPELEIYAGATEVQLLRYYEPNPGIFIAESPNVIERALDSGYEPISFLIERTQVETRASGILKRCEETPVYIAEKEVLEQITGFHLTRGILCAMRRKIAKATEKICDGARRVVVLEDVVNPTNVGAIFRSAAALNMDAVLLTPACTDPLYRRAIRVSMGTVFQVPWTYMKEEKTELEKLKQQGFKTVAMALTDDSVGIDDERLQKEEKLAVILGTEGDGLAKETIADCDYTVKIPMAHGVDSLNVAAASAVAFWELGKRS